MLRVNNCRYGQKATGYYIFKVTFMLSSEIHQFTLQVMGASNYNKQKNT